MTGTARRVAAAALAGGATGCRSFTGIGLLAAAAEPGSTGQPDRSLADTRAKAALLALTAGEYVGDKMPQTPSRSQPPGVASRAVGAGASGVVVSRRGVGGDLRLDALCVGTALAGAAGSIWLGLRWRSWAAQTFRHDWIGAVIEDGVAVGLAGLAVRLARPA